MLPLSRFDSSDGGAATGAQDDTAKRWLATAVALLTVAFAATASAQAKADGYTVNGRPVAPEMAALLEHGGFAPGPYYVDRQGNYGKSGQPPQGNLDGGPPRGWTGTEPRGIANNPYAQAYVNGVSGVRVFWVYSPSIFSGASGGSSGYYHICPNHVFHRSSEGATSIGGNGSWAGVAGTSSGGGRWKIERGAAGPVLALFGQDGNVQRVPIATMLQGRWKAGQTTYAVEQGKASC